MNIKELVEAMVPNLENFSRSKVAREVADKLKVAGTKPERGVMSAIYNEVDDRAKELARNVKVAHIISSKVSARIGSDLSLEETHATRSLTTRIYTPVDTVRELSLMLEKRASAFIKEPSESRIKAYYKCQRALAYNLFMLKQSEAPEDVTVANNYTVHMEQLTQRVKHVHVIA